MKRFALLAAAVLVCAIAVAPTVYAQDDDSIDPNVTTVTWLGVGSSAMWQDTAVAAWTDLAGGKSGGALHYTVKGSCTHGNCAQVKDQRSSTIPLQGGNLWVVWNKAQTQVWAYLTLDSVVGNQSFFAAPRRLLQLDSQLVSLPGQNLISSALFDGVADATALPSVIYNALNGAKVQAAATDIRPEDAKYAECRATTPLNKTTYGGLGYGTSCTQLIGTNILSNFSTSAATPVAFNLSGKDPFTGATIPAYTTIPVGAAPIIFVDNRTNANGLGKGGTTPAFNNLNLAIAQKLFNGTECDGNAFGISNPPPNFPVHLMLREPLSGTMNTTEFTNFRIKANPNNSQEVGIDPSKGGTKGVLGSNNPLYLACTAGGGDRQRGIGTGEVMNGSGSTGGVLNVQDSVGYTFFSYGNVSKLAGSNSYGYFRFAQVDPINATYTNGQLPVCTAPCPKSPGTSFPHLRDGTYRSWSILRMVTDASGVNNTNTKALVTAAQNHINSTVPDFVPFVPTTDGDPGLLYYRSHYLQSGVAPSNTPEAGGDMGGCIFHGPPDNNSTHLNCHQ